MSRDCDASLRRQVAALAVGFLFVLSVASSLADPLPTPANSPLEVDVTSSVATPLGSAQLVASASDRDEGLSPVPPKEAPTPESDDVKQTEVAASGAAVPPLASEAGDMMKDPYHNVTTMSTSDRDEEAVINNETDIVQDSHVNPINKTHEEEASNTSPNATLDSSTQQPSVQDGSSAPTTESSTGKVEQPDRDEKVEDKEQSNKTPEEMDVTEKDGEMSLAEAEVTSLPVSALVSQHDAHDHPAISRTSSLNHTTQAAAILGGVLVLVALMGYLGLLLWRRVLEKRYGNREMLVNEDDDDIKHFEL